jgi:hypothetical protein
MIGYSLLDDEKPQAQPILRPAPTIKQKNNAFLKIKTECDLVVLGFVLATILLLLSDLNK